MSNSLLPNDVYDTITFTEQKVNMIKQLHEMTTSKIGRHWKYSYLIKGSTLLNEDSVSRKCKLK